MLNSRRCEARRSVNIQVSSEKSYNELYHYCSQFGVVKNAFHYRNDKKAHRILIEFETEESAQHALQAAVFDEPYVPASSHFMWFRASRKQSTAKESNDIPPLNTIDGNDPLSSTQLNELLMDQPSIDEQIQALYRHTAITDLGYRLRFLAAAQIEDCARALFPAAQAVPFGSSVNGFGRVCSDLDLNLITPDADHVDDNRRLVFHTRSNVHNERSAAQQHLGIVASIMSHVLPGIRSVQSILQARVPIVRYNQEYLNLQVDVSLHNM